MMRKPRTIDLAPEVVDAIILRAHDLILTRGWCQRQNVDIDDRMCIHGAVTEAVREHMAVGSALDDIDRYYAILDTVEMRICQTINPRYRTTYQIIPWNDRTDRTYDDVLDLLRQATKDNDARNEDPEHLGA